MASPAARATIQGVDLERTVQFLVETQAQFAADLQQLRSISLNLAHLQTEQAKNHNDLSAVVREIAEILRRAEQERLRAEEERRRAEEENRKAHLRFEETHRESDERFNALIKMMDEWIRERRRNNGLQ